MWVGWKSRVAITRPIVKKKKKKWERGREIKINNNGQRKSSK